MSFKETLKKFIQENLVHEVQGQELADDEPLIERGVIDSMGLMQILLFLEEQTGIRIPDEEVLLDNFQTIASIEQTVQRLSARRGGTPGSLP